MSNEYEFYSVAMPFSQFVRLPAVAGLLVAAASGDRQSWLCAVALVAAWQEAVPPDAFDRLLQFQETQRRNTQLTPAEWNLHPSSKAVKSKEYDYGEARREFGRLRRQTDG